MTTKESSRYDIIKMEGQTAALLRHSSHTSVRGTTHMSFHTKETEQVYSIHCQYIISF